MPRVTRAQAEAAMRSLKWRADAWAGERACRDDLAMQANERFEATLRAYLAQRPDEDTVRRGHEFTRQIDEGYVFCECGHDFEVHRATAHQHGDEPVLPCDVEGCACLDFQASMDVPLAAIRAAMYQPEEEA